MAAATHKNEQQDRRKEYPREATCVMESVCGIHSICSSKSFFDTRSGLRAKHRLGVRLALRVKRRSGRFGSEGPSVKKDGELTHLDSFRVNICKTALYNMKTHTPTITILLRSLLAFGILIGYVSTVSGQETTSLGDALSRARQVTATPSRDSVEVFFRQSQTELDPAFHDNGRRLDSLARVMSGLKGASDVRMTRLRISGAASPEGSYDFNKWLSEERAKRIVDYFSRLIPMPDSITEVRFLGRDWPGLVALVRGDMNVPGRTAVLDALAEAGADHRQLSEAESNHLLSSLKLLQGGKPYRYMYENLFPLLRNSQLSVEYSRFSEQLPPESVELQPELPAIEQEDSLIMVEEELFETPIPSVPRNFYMDISTNMLLDAGLVPNIGVEFYVGKNISVYGQWMHAWWSNDAHHRYWRMYGGDVGARWWFGKQAHEKPLTGHHLGVYAGAFTYDFELGGTGYMGGMPHGTIWDRCFVNAGVEYGYSLPVAKRLNIDFTIGIGYMGGKYIKYEPGSKPHLYYWENTKHLNWVGPTKAEISLVWLIGRGNTN